MGGRRQQYIWVTSPWTHILPKSGNFLVNCKALLQPLLNFFTVRHLFLGFYKECRSNL